MKRYFIIIFFIFSISNMYSQDFYKSIDSIKIHINKEIKTLTKEIKNSEQYNNTKETLNEIFKDSKETLSEIMGNSKETFKEISNDSDNTFSEIFNNTKKACSEIYDEFKKDSLYNPKK